MAFITGGARHFGLEIANALASAGADLVITSLLLLDASRACSCPRCASSCTDSPELTSLCPISNGICP